jgi:hypothetical protein
MKTTILMWTISEFRSFDMISYWSTHEKLALSGEKLYDEVFSMTTQYLVFIMGSKSFLILV